MVSPAIIAAIASAITVILYRASGRISNKYAKGTAQLVSVILGLIVSASLSADPEVASVAGQYFFYMMIAIAILAKLFGKKLAVTEPEA